MYIKLKNALKLTIAYKVYRALNEKRYVFSSRQVWRSTIPQQIPLSLKERFKRAPWLFLWRCSRFYIFCLPRSSVVINHDRFILEDVIFKEVLTSRNYKRILFVGCAEYTSWYPRLFRFFPLIQMSTIDPDPAKVMYAKGAAAHFVGGIETFQSKEPFDLIIFSGVFNYGVNLLEEKQNAVDSIYRLLSPNGNVLVGISANPKLDTTFDLKADLEMFDKRRFHSAKIPGVHSHTYQTDSLLGHCFSFYRRAEICSESN